MIRGTAIECAYAMARTGDYANFTQIKNALHGRFAVDRELYGRSLARDLTRLCREAAQARTAA